MTEQSGEHKAHLPQNQTEKERIESALLTPADTWLHDILRDDFEVTDEWRQVFNAQLKLAIKNIDPRRGSSKEASKIKRARSFVYYELARDAKTDSVKIKDTLLNWERISQHPLLFVENARLLSSFGLDIAFVMQRAAIVFCYKTSILAARVDRNVELYGDRVKKLMQTTPEVFLANSPKHTDLKLSAVSKVTNMFGLAETGIDLAEQVPRAVSSSLPKSFAIARIALEFGENDNTTHPSQINTALTQPLDAHMLALLEDRRYNLGRAETYRRRASDEERRVRVLRLLSPNSCKRLGGNVLRSYFRASPLSETEARRFTRLAKDGETKFRNYDQRFEHHDALLSVEEDAALLSDLSGREAELVDEAWVERLNKLLKIGSRDARTQVAMGEHGPIARARLAFLRELGWLDESHDLYKKVATYLKRQPRGISPVAIVRTARFAKECSVQPLEFIKASPHLATVDIEPKRRRKKIIQRVFAFSDHEESKLFARFANAFDFSDGKLEALVYYASIYKLHQSDKPFSIRQIQMILESPIEAHKLAVEFDRAKTPQQAEFYSKQYSIAEIRRFLKRRTSTLDT